MLKELDETLEQLPPPVVLVKPYRETREQAFRKLVLKQLQEQMLAMRVGC